MKQLIILLLPALLWSRLATAQEVKPQGTLVIDEKLASRFVRQAPLLKKAAIAQHLKKKTGPVPDWLMPEPGDRMVTYYQPGDTLLFYQSGRTVTLYWCSISHAASFAQTVPFLASTKATLFAGKYQTRSVFTVEDAAILGVYTMILKFQSSHLRSVVFNLDTSTF